MTHVQVPDWPSGSTACKRARRTNSSAVAPSAIAVNSDVVPAGSLPSSGWASANSAKSAVATAAIASVTPLLHRNAIRSTVISTPIPAIRDPAASISGWPVSVKRLFRVSVTANASTSPPTISSASGQPTIEMLLMGAAAIVTQYTSTAAAA